MTGASDRCANCDAPTAPDAWKGQPRLVCTGCDYWWTEERLAEAWQHRVEPPEGASLSLLFEDNGRQHADLVLRVGAWVHRCDSYYFELDHPVGTAPDPVGAMRALLLHWKGLVASARDEPPCFLAFAFYDQATGWVRCVRRGSDLELCPGWSGAHGYEVYPSDTLEWATALSDFEPVPESVPLRVDATKLLCDIDRSLAALPESRRGAGEAEAAHRRRARRLEDFIERATFEDDGVGAPGIVQLAGVGLYVPLHPMADEAEVLARLEMSPGQCRTADLYVAMSGDVRLVQFITSAESMGDRGPGVYGRASDGEGYADNFVIVVEDAQISSALVDEGLRALRAILEGAPALGESLTRLE